MNILEPYISIKSYTSPYKIEREYNNKIKQLEEQREKVIVNNFMSLLNNFNFKRKIINNYRENIDTLCCDIYIINILKQSYNKTNDTFLEIGIENECTAQFNYNYKDNYTYYFDVIGHDIEKIIEDIESCSSFDDMCNFNLKLPEENYYNFISARFQSAESYDGEYIYYLKKIYYPIILKIEEIINSNSKEFIELIKKYE